MLAMDSPSAQGRIARHLTGPGWFAAIAIAGTADGEAAGGGTGATGEDLARVFLLIWGNEVLRKRVADGEREGIGAGQAFR